MSTCLTLHWTLWSRVGSLYPLLALLTDLHHTEAAVTENIIHVLLNAKLGKMWLFIPLAPVGTQSSKGVFEV